MAVTADRVVVELQAKLDQYRRELAAGDRDFDRHMKNMRTQAGLTERATVKSFGVIGAAGGAMAASLRSSALALAGVAGATAGIRVLADFAQAMSTVRAVTGATETQFDALEKKARQLGATTRFSATQAAEGMLYLARAGFDTDQVLGSIEGTLRLAQAGNLDLGRAADIASNVLQGFRLEVTETARVVDVLALAANSSNTDVGQLGEAMKYAAPIAAGLKVGVEDTAAAVSALSDAGIQASMAGTGLRRVMIGLETQSKQGQKVLAKYGLTMEDISMRSTGSLANSLQRLADAGITTADAMTLFGLRGGPAFEVLQSSIPKVRELTAEYEAAGGTAERIAEVMDKNLNGALLQTKSRLQELILAMGEAGAEDTLIAALEGLSALLTLAAENADILSVAIVALTVRALLPMAAAMGGKVLAAAAGLRAQLVILNAIAGTSVTTLGSLAAVGGRLAFAFGPLSLAIGAAAAAYVVLARNAREGREAMERARASIERMNKALQETADFSPFETLADEAAFANPVIERLRDALGDVADEIKRIGSLTLAQQAATILAEINEAKSALEDLEKQRAKALAGREAVSRYAAAETGGVGSLSGDGKTKFDKDIRDANAEIARLEARLRAMGKGIFGEGGVNIAEALRKGGFEELAKQIEQRFTGVINTGVIARELENIAALQSQLETAKEKGLDTAAARFEQQIEIAQETIRLLEAGLDEGSAREVARETVQDRRSNDSGDLNQQTKRALEEIRDGYRKTFETEREMVARIRDERLAAIEKAKIGQAEADDLREKANAVYLEQIAEIEAAELRADNESYQRRANQTAKEISLLEEIERARDEMLGRSLALLEREYEARRAAIEREIKDNERKQQALAALDEEYAARRQEHEDRVLGRGRHASSEVERLQAEQAEKLALLEEWYAENLDREQEYLARRIEINAEAEAEITRMRQEAAAAQLDAAEKGFGAAHDLAKKFAGQNKGITKALFLAEKAAALASAYVQMNLAVAKASAAAPPPANVPLITAARVTGMATIAGIAASAISGFKDGVVRLRGPGTTRSDSIPAWLSKDESVMTAEATRKNERLLRLMNDGVDVEGQLARINQPLNVNQSIIGGGARNVSVAGSSLIFNGPVDEGSIPALRALIDQRDREIEDRIRQVIARDRTRSTPRHERPRFFQD